MGGAGRGKVLDSIAAMRFQKRQANPGKTQSASVKKNIPRLHRAAPQKGQVLL